MNSKNLANLLFFLKANSVINQSNYNLIRFSKGKTPIKMLGRYEENLYLYWMMKVVGNKQTSLYEMPGFDHGTMTWPGSHILQKNIEQILKSKSS